MLLQRGVQFAPGYRLQEFLGRGQFGQVWRAAAPGGAVAAVKFIDLSDGQGQKEYDGIRRVKQIRQANLMPITAIWLLDGEGRVIEEAPDEAVQTIDFAAGNPIDQTGVVVMPQPDASWLVVAMLLGGMSLQQRLRECVGKGLTGIPVKELISLMDESAKGLDFLNSPIHDLGEGPIAIQHCDVKPANIVLIGNSAVVCDFGLARILTRSQATATSASGTPAYMAPEAIEGKPSRTSDQYSLAVTYYQLRTGTLPVNDGSLWQVLDSHRRGKLNFDLVPPREREVLRRATQLDWQQRFESNVDMVDALREALRNEGKAQPSFQASSPHADQSRLTSPFANTDGGSLINDPTATLLSEFDEPVVAESIKYMETRDVASAEASTRRDLSNDSVGPSEPVSSPVSSSSAPRRKALAAGVVGLALSAVLGGWMLFGGTKPEKIVPAHEEPVEVLTADEWMSRARSRLRQGAADEATLAFSNALAIDPSLSELQALRTAGHSSPVAAIEFATDASSLVTLGEDAFPILWQLDGLSDPPLGTIPHFDINTVEPVGDSAIEVSPDGKWLVMGERGGGLSVQSLVDNQAMKRISLPGHDDDVLDAAWHPSGNFIVTIAADNQLGVWELAPVTNPRSERSLTRHRMVDTKKMYESFAMDARCVVLISIDGEVDAFAWSDLVGTLDAPASPQPHAVTAAGDAARYLALFNSNETSTTAVVAGASGVVTLWSVDEARTEKLASSADVASDPVGGTIESLAVVKRDADILIATGTENGSVSVWSYGRENQTRKLTISEFPIASIDVSSSGDWLAASTRGGAVSLVYLAGDLTKSCLLDVPGDGGYRVKIDPSGRWLVGGGLDGAICVWDVEHAKLVALSRLP